MIPPEEHGDVAIDEDTADIADRDDAEETTHLQQGQQPPNLAEETFDEVEEELKAEEDIAEDTPEGIAEEIEAQDEDMASWAGQPSIKGSTETMRMMLLTFSLIGLQ
jgi:hypothetical protein